MRVLIILLSVFAALMAPVRAQSESLCPMIHALAKQVMESRQAGVALPDLMKSFDKFGETAVGEYGKKLAVRAYKTPRYSVDANRAEAAVDFANDIATECYSAESKKRAQDEDKE